MAIKSNSHARCVSVEVKGPEQLEFALKLLKRKLKKENLYVELRRKEFYQKPSEIKKAKQRRRKTSDGDDLNQL
jgi:ribosomal protein S21|tara:strand:- start:623 stop:844 length:222 start_codon:yes stop_codon:yes gene_type:complete